MPQIAALHIYPVKSCTGISLQWSDVERRGLAGDRRYVLVGDDDVAVTQREEPRLAIAGVDVARFREPPPAPGPDAEWVFVKVWDDTVGGLVCAHAEAERLSAFLGRRVRILYMAEGTERLVDPKFAGATDIVSFADAFPVLVASEASLSDLNARLTEKIGMDRFRPNIVLSGTSAFEEDERAGFRAGDVTFRLVKPCSRCSMVTVDPTKGTTAKEPLATLAKYRTTNHRTLFGMNALVSGTGRVAVGDSIEWI